WPQATLAAQPVAHAPLAPLEVVLGHRRAPALLLLAFLAQDLLARILDALALVGLGRPHAADLGGHLPDLLPVGAADLDLGRLRRPDRDARRDRIDHLVAEAQLQL